MQLDVEQGTEEDLYWAPGSHLHMSLIYGEGVSPGIQGSSIYQWHP